MTLYVITGDKQVRKLVKRAVDGHFVPDDPLRSLREYPFVDEAHEDLAEAEAIDPTAVILDPEAEADKGAGVPAIGSAEALLNWILKYKPRLPVIIPTRAPGTKFDIAALLNADVWMGHEPRPVGG